MGVSSRTHPNYFQCLELIPLGAPADPLLPNYFQRLKMIPELFSVYELSILVFESLKTPHGVPEDTPEVFLDVENNLGGFGMLRIFRECHRKG